MRQPSLFDAGDEPAVVVADPPDQGARLAAVDPTRHVVLEASAGTGKTRVLVDRYVRLLLAGVDPRNILAMTFTRKAAAEMRARVLGSLERLAATDASGRRLLQSMRDRLADVQITTIDGFCFSLLREFPLEADVSPAFEVADETEMARFSAEATAATLDVARRLSTDDEAVRLLLARVKAPVLKEALAMLVDRRHVSLPAVARFVERRGSLGSVDACRRFLDHASAAVALVPDSAFFDDGPVGSPAFARLAEELRSAGRTRDPDPAKVRLFRRRVEQYFLTVSRQPRKRVAKPYTAGHFQTPSAKRRHEEALAKISPAMAAALESLDRDIDTILARGVLRLLAIAVSTYERMLEQDGLLDFAGMLERAVRLVERQEEFARSRLKLQARYHHLLIDEFQDTSRLQWRLIDRLVSSWAEGQGVTDAPTSVFIVGDRKQSIYRFRHAEVTLLDEAAERIGALQTDRPVRQAISASFRAVPELLAFVNALGEDMAGDESTGDGWRYTASDRFPAPPLADAGRRDGRPVVSLVTEPTLERAAAAVADEIVRIIGAGESVRDRDSGPRPAQADDIAILFRARAGHQYFEEALAARGVPTYVYKGLGFYDAPEVQDLQALFGFIARPDSELHAAAFLRSRFVRLSDQALVALAPGFAAAVLGAETPGGMATMDEVDRRLLELVRGSAPEWLALSATTPPADLVDRIIRESAYASELRGARLDQARENVKKVRALVRRVESRGYATFDRLASYFDTLRAGDDSNAVIDAAGAVSLMTIHAAKGLEFPIVFVVNLQAPGRGRPPGFSVIEHGADGEPEVTFGSTASTELEDRRDTEELRRLLYVAVTRARDRLYLSATVTPEGVFTRPKRSLAWLLPDSLAAAFSTAALAEGDFVQWERERPFVLGVCRPPAEPRQSATPAMPVVRQARQSPVTPVIPATRVVRTATELTAGRSDVPGVSEPEPSDVAGRLVGTLVHRLMPRGVRSDASDAEIAEAVRALVTPADLLDVGDLEAEIPSIVAAFRSLAGQPDLVSLLASGECLYEVPFSFLEDPVSGSVIRGVVDCLVIGADRVLTVVEFKTGRPRPEHEAQAALYARAISSIFGAHPVGTRVFYATQQDSASPGLSPA
jgi:ATP-dependent helicase/nuclease subunit A